MKERERRLKKGVKEDSETQRRSLTKMLDFPATEQRKMDAAVRRSRRDRTDRISVPHTLRHNVPTKASPSTRCCAEGAKGNRV